MNSIVLMKQQYHLFLKLANYPRLFNMFETVLLSRNMMSLVVKYNLLLTFKAKSNLMS